jgi:predicted enzyme related to lactoylglutathione lyase
MTENHIDYIEFRAPDLKAIKTFYTSCFGWKFTDYGPDYTSFENSGVSGGFERSDVPDSRGVLVILYHRDLEAIRETILQSGGTIQQDIFSFPGGKRFHFCDPAGNELAVWSDQ